MKCNHCKNPVKAKDVLCEWCGREITLFQSTDDNHPINNFEEELREIELTVRKEIQARVDNKNTNTKEGLLGKIFGTTNFEQWDEDNEEEVRQQVYKSQAKAVTNFILPTNPKLLREIKEFADNNYRLNKVSFWDEDDENKNKLQLSLAWLHLANTANNKLGIESNRSAVNNIVTYLNKNSNLKWGIIVFAVYVFLFLVIALLNYFQE